MEKIKKKKCDKCSGKGYVYEKPEGSLKKHNITCPKCQGKCQLDWVEMITGIEDDDTVITFHIPVSNQMIEKGYKIDPKGIIFP